MSRCADNNKYRSRQAGRGEEGSQSTINSESFRDGYFFIFRFLDIQSMRVSIGKCITRRTSFAVAQQKAPKGASPTFKPRTSLAASGRASNFAAQ